jgi:hypothetical protein
VLEAASYSEAAARAAWVRSQLQQQLVGGPDAVLRPMTVEGPEVGPRSNTYLRFRAKLNRNFHGKRKGDKVWVEGDVGNSLRRQLRMHADHGYWSSSVGPLVVAADSYDMQV